MSVATLVATPDPDHRPDDNETVQFSRATLRSMNAHPSNQRGRVARGSYRRHPLGLFVVDGAALREVPSA